MRNYIKHCRISVSALAVSAAMIGACSSDLTNADQDKPVATDTGHLWTGNQTCDACLQGLCGDTDAGPGAYTNCKAEANCHAAMSTFTSCFATKPALTDCSMEVDSLRNASSAGSELLDCLLLKCFFVDCESIRPLQPR
jgi:hypothetical protein